MRKIYKKVGDQLIQVKYNPNVPQNHKVEIQSVEKQQMNQEIPDKPQPKFKTTVTLQYMLVKARNMFRQELLVWMTPEEVVRLASLNRKIKESIDSNRAIFELCQIDSEDYNPQKSDQIPAAIQRRISSHFEQIFKVQVRPKSQDRLFDLALVKKCYTISDLKELRKKQNLLNHFDQAQDFCQIQGLIPEQQQFLAKMWQEQGSVLDQKVEPKNTKGGYFGYQDLQQPGVLENPIRGRILKLKKHELSEQFHQIQEFCRTKSAKYIRIIQIFCDSKVEQEKQSDPKNGLGVSGIGRRFQIKYNL